MSAEADTRVRRAEERDLDALLTIHAAAFPDPRGREARRKNFTENARGGLSDLWVAERRGRVLAHGFLFPMRSWFGGREVKVGGVASVGVAPEARRTRIARALLLQMLMELRARTVPISMLYPFRHDFYRRLGWGLVGETRRYRFLPEALPLYDERALVVEGRPERLDGVRACYEAYAQGRTALLARSDAVWLSLVRSESVRVAQVPGSGSEVTGYCFYRFVGDPNLARQEIEVLELVARTDPARFALYGFLSAQRDQVKRIQISLPPDEPLHALLREPRGIEEEPIRGLTFVSAQLAVGLMLRIVDLPRALRARGWTADGDVVVTSPDRLLGDTASVRVEARGGVAEVGPPTGGGPELTAEPSALAQIYSGFLSVSRAVAYRLARVEPASAVPELDRLFALPPPATLDVF